MTPRWARERAIAEETKGMGILLEGMCLDCGGWLDGHTSNLTGPCDCYKGDSMSEAQLPITEAQARPMFASLDTPLAQLTGRLDALRGKPLTRMSVELIKEWDDEAKRYLKAAEDSEPRKAVESAFRVHRFLSAMFKKATDPVLDGRKWASQQMGRWEQQRRAEADAERRKREDEARKEQERQRLEEAAHLEAQGHKEEAIAHLEAPLPPPVLPDPIEPKGKVQGVTVITTYAPDMNDPFADPKAFYHFIAEHPEYHHHQDLSLSKWKRTLTDAKGTLEVPGLRVVAKEETRNRG